MTLKNTISFLESLKTETTIQSEIKTYNQFIEILTKLENKDFTLDKIQSIEKELDKLNLKSNPKNRKEFFKKAINDFKKYLKTTFSLTTKGYYRTYYSALGLSFGLLFGVVILSNLGSSLGIFLGLLGGMVVGTILGKNKESQAKAAGNIL